MFTGLDLSDRIRDTASDSTLDSSTLESEVDSDYLEETGSTGDKENKCRKCGEFWHRFIQLRSLTFPLSFRRRPFEIAGSSQWSVGTSQR